MADSAGLLFEDGSHTMIKPVHVSEGTEPAGSTWAMIPVAPTNLGPMCKPGPHDNPDAPHSCAAKNNPKTPCGCTPCPQTPGSDCSRCDNCQEPAFTPLAAHDGKPVEGVSPVVGIMDVVKIPPNLAPGKCEEASRFARLHAWLGVSLTALTALRAGRCTWLSI